MNATRGRKVLIRLGGKGAADISVFGGGVEPDEASAASFVYSCVSFLAPVSTSRAESRSEALKAMEALRRSNASW
jgi:hypothetical protein